MVVRAALQDDLHLIRKLLAETWHHTYDSMMGADRVAAMTERWHTVENLEREIERPNHLLLVAERAGVLAATASATLLQDGLLRLGRLYVSPAFQRGGVGGALLEAVMQAYSTARTIRLEVETANRNGRAFYERHGFRWSGEVKHDEAGETLVYERAAPSRRDPACAPFALRTASDEDAQDLFGLLALCFAEYPGCYVDPHDDLVDLRRPGRSFLGKGAFVVVEDERSRICACVALDQPEAGLAEMHRLYVRPDKRRRGLGARLIRLVEARARGQGAGRLFFWSDTRFQAAHRLYERLGYRRVEGTRALGDISGSIECRFEKAL